MTRNLSLTPDMSSASSTVILSKRLFIFCDGTDQDGLVDLVQPTQDLSPAGAAMFANELITSTSLCLNFQ